MRLSLLIGFHMNLGLTPSQPKNGTNVMWRRVLQSAGEGYFIVKDATTVVDELTHMGFWMEKCWDQSCTRDLFLRRFLIIVINTNIRNMQVKSYLPNPWFNGVPLVNVDGKIYSDKHRYYDYQPLWHRSCKLPNSVFYENMLLFLKCYRNSCLPFAVTNH
jgi:hypothetical protein